MESILISPKDLNEFHTAAKFFLNKLHYTPIRITQTNAVPSSVLDLLKISVPKLGKNIVTIHVQDDKFTTYGKYVTTLDVIGCIAYESHATSFKYIQDKKEVMYFDSHGSAPKPMIARLLKHMFNGCTITYNTKSLQGRHGVCSLWAIWFCLLMSVSSTTMDKIQLSTLDDTNLDGSKHKRIVDRNGEAKWDNI